MPLINCAIEIMDKFLNNTYYIPNYQRDYSWEEPELADFWNDLIATKNNEDGIDHFFGQIVIHNDQENHRLYIIDGQQRTITSTIFMRALRYFYNLIYLENQSPAAKYRTDDIDGKHVGRYIPGVLDELHLHLGELDHDYFRDKIQSGEPDCSNVRLPRKAQKNLRRTYAWFYKKIFDELKGAITLDEKIDILNEFYETFVKKFNVLYMEATKLEEAFVIFETLNARGKELETADLLKNFIFSQSRDVESAQRLWNSMMSKLDHADPTKFIRHFWNATHSFVREKGLYKSIAKNASTPRASRELLHNLDAAALCYHDMSFPDEAKGYTDKKLISTLKSLKKLKASSFYPVLIAVNQLPNPMPEKDVCTIAEALETYVFRNFTICGKVANSAEVFLASVAREIFERTLESASAIVERISAETVSDVEFFDQFKIWTGNSSSKETIRYIFRKIHHYLDENNELNLDNSEVHIEHIMPEDATQWDVDEETHSAYLWRLGNLMLLSGPINIEISNKPFLDKVNGYTESKIEPNAEVAEKMQWTAKEIEERQVALAELALKIWEK